MKPYNICLIQPEGYIHSGGFAELAKLIFYALRELGVSVALQKNRVDGSARNIMIGIHLVTPKLIMSLPPDTIIINTEQLSSMPSRWKDNILEGMVGDFELWDYNERNIEYLNGCGITNIKKINLGYQKELRCFEVDDDTEFDVLFYGSTNERRKVIFDGLRDSGAKMKTLYGVYGEQRDRWIRNSKLVLNCHFYDAHIFEIVRVFYLLTNSVAVVGEVNPTTSIDNWVREAIALAPYDGLVSKVHELLDDRHLLDHYRKRGFEMISQFPQAAYMKELI